MRKSAVAVAIIVFSTVVYSVNAEDDFSALLADLTFTDEPGVAEPLSKAAAEPVEGMKPVPEFAMPATAPAMVDLSDILETADLENRDLEQPAELETEMNVLAPRIALQDPVPSEQPAISKSPSSTGQQYDLNEAFALQTPSLAVPSRGVGHRQVDTAYSACGGCDQSVGCDNSMMCRPHSSVNLPTSTLLQYFRSNPCYTNVWDGYQRKCVHHTHLHGTCDCFRRNCHDECGEVLECAPCAPANSVKCDGTCD